MTKGGYKFATKALIIARVSTEEQAKDGHYSIPRQLRKIKEYVESGGRFEAIKEWEECELSGVTAFKETKKFKEITKRVENSDEPIALVFNYIDRFTRNIIRIADYEKLRLAGKVELHFVFDDLVMYRNSRAGDIKKYHREAVDAQNVSLMISEKVKDVICEKLEQGKYPGGDLPTGYKVDVKFENGKLIKKKIFDKKRADFVVRAFRLFATDRYSAKTLAVKLASAGFTTKSKNGTGKSVTAVDILNILNNPFYFGKFHYRNPDTGERELWPKKGRATNYPTLMKDWRLFERVREILKKHNSRADGYNENFFKFRGLIKCGFCDHTLTPEEMSRSYKDKDNPNAKTVYYHCNNGKHHSDPDWYRKKFGTEHSGAYIAKKGKLKGEMVYACPQRWWKEEEIEQWILDELGEIEYGEDVYDWFRSTLETEYEGEAEILEEQIKIARLELSKNEDIIKGLIRSIAVESDTDLREAFRSEYGELKARQEELKKEIRELEDSKDADVDELVKRLRYCSNLKNQYQSLDDEMKREFLAAVFSRIAANKGEWRLKKGKGRKVKTDMMNFSWEEPFSTLCSNDIENYVVQERENRKKKLSLTKKKEIEASQFP